MVVVPVAPVLHVTTPCEHCADNVELPPDEILVGLELTLTGAGGVVHVGTQFLSKVGFIQSQWSP